MDDHHPNETSELGFVRGDASLSEGSIRVLESSFMGKPSLHQRQWNPRSCLSQATNSVSDHQINLFQDRVVRPEVVPVDSLVSLRQ